MDKTKISDSSIRWGFFLGYTVTCLSFWLLKPDALHQLGAAFLSGLPQDTVITTEINYSLLVGLLLVAIPFATLELIVLLKKHRNEYAAVASDISQNRRQIVKDLGKVASGFIFTIGLGAFGLFSLGAKKWVIDDSVFSFVAATIICYMVVELTLEMAKYVPMVRHLFSK
jgi:hypothetical protein